MIQIKYCNRILENLIKDTSYSEFRYRNTSFDTIRLNHLDTISFNYSINTIQRDIKCELISMGLGYYILNELKRLYRTNGEESKFIKDKYESHINKMFEEYKEMV
jgi:hypothetical protein